MSQRGSDPIALIAADIVIFIVFLVAVEMLPGWVWLGFVGLFVGFYYFDRWRVSKLPPCIGCGKKGTFVFQHRRVDGGPDRRGFVAQVER